jgi:hypothetical protein
MVERHRMVEQRHRMVDICVLWCGVCERARCGGLGAFASRVCVIALMIALAERESDDEYQNTGSAARVTQLCKKPIHSAHFARRHGVTCRSDGFNWHRARPC